MFRTIYRVRWWRPAATGEPSATEPTQDELAAACGADPGAAATIEADGGDGQIVAVAIGGAGVVWRTDDDVTDAGRGFVVRHWAVDGAEEAAGDLAEPWWTLAEYRGEGAEIFGDTDEPRLLTLAGDDDTGELEVYAVDVWTAGDGDDGEDDADEWLE
jgi:hypothetical protein